MLTEIRHTETATNPAGKDIPFEAWRGKRHDGVWFVADSREKLETFSECACVVGHPCEAHVEQRPTLVWNDPVRLN